MRKEDLSVPALLAEAVGIVMGAVYIVLQVFYGVKYRIVWFKPFMNVALGASVYAALTLLSVYPERINHLPPELCRGDIRKYSIRMVRITKLVFVSGLMVPCVCDVIGHAMPRMYTAGVVAVLLLVALYYEYRIINILRENDRKE